MQSRKSPYEYVLSVRIELAKLILVVTRITYQATGDAGLSEPSPAKLQSTRARSAIRTSTG